MKRFVIGLLCLLGTLFPGPVSHSQIPASIQAQLAERLHSLSDKAPSEVVYIQTSKDYYESGEDLWFKVYLLDSRFHIPSAGSRTLYVQLMAETTRKVVWQEYYPIEFGTSPGHIYLDPGLSDGYYLLMAFTTHSLADDSSEIKSLKRIRITRDVNTALSDEPNTVLQNTRNRQARAQAQEVTASASGDIIFTAFPEGGEMVAGIPGMVAFKAVDSGGLPADITGILYEDSQPVFEFQTTHLGMGKFLLTPVSGKKYSVRLTEPASDRVYDLPEPASSGIKMTVARTDINFIYLIISKTNDVTDQTYYLRLQSRGIVYGLATGKLERESGIRLPVDELPAGIAEITLFNEALLPVAERLVFVNGYRKLNLTTALTKEICETREKNTLKVTVKDESGKPVTATLGVTLFDRIYQNRADSSDIVTHLFLGSQLKGKIYNPSWYFNGDIAEREKALDLLMLTHGWRKYLWSEDNLAGYSEAKPVVGDNIGGSIVIPAGLRLRRNRPEESAYLMAFSPNVNEMSLLIVPDSGNRFFITPELLTEWKGDFVYLKPYGNDNSQPRVVMENPFTHISMAMKARDLVYFPVAAVNRSRSQPQVLFDVRVVKVPEVTVTGDHTTLRGRYMGMLDSLARFSRPDYVCRHNILNCINHPHEPDNRKPVEGEVYQMRNSSGQIVTVRYKLPEYNEEELMKLNNLYRIKAYYGNRIFFQPDYETWDGGEEPDFRNTLLWAPDIITDESGEATIEFNSSDVNTVFTIKIEGISYDGRPGTGFSTLTVRKPMVR